MAGEDLLFFSLKSKPLPGLARLRLPVGWWEAEAELIGNEGREKKKKGTVVGLWLLLKEHAL